MAVIVKNSWVDRRGLVLLTGGYVASAALILIVNLA